MFKTAAVCRVWTSDIMNSLFGLTLFEKKEGKKTERKKLLQRQHNDFEVTVRYFVFWGRYIVYWGDSEVILGGV